MALSLIVINGFPSLSIWYIKKCVCASSVFTASFALAFRYVCNQIFAMRYIWANAKWPVSIKKTKSKTSINRMEGARRLLYSISLVRKMKWNKKVQIHIVESVARHKTKAKTNKQTNEQIRYIYTHKHTPMINCKTVINWGGKILNWAEVCMMWKWRRVTGETRRDGICQHKRMQCDQQKKCVCFLMTAIVVLATVQSCIFYIFSYFSFQPNVFFFCFFFWLLSLPFSYLNDSFILFSLSIS